MTLTPRPSDVPSLLRALVASDSGRPRITWYGADGERIELSARVLENWVAKTANLLLDELDAGPGTTVRIALPPHWRTAVWALACSAVGVALVADADADVVVAASASAVPGARSVVVALPGLARSSADLPAGALDYNAEVPAFDDVLAPASPAPLPVAASRWPDSVRLLVTPASFDVVATLVEPLLADGSVVLSEREDEAWLDMVRNQENVTAVVE